MLYCIGLGLGSPEDITLRGLKAIQGCTRVYLEAYTSILVDVGFSEEKGDCGQQGSGIEHLVRIFAPICNNLRCIRRRPF
jgi:diphthine synthase